LEVKSSRKRIIKRENIPKNWVEQLSMYMAKVDKNVGWLVILNIWTVSLACFCLEMTTKELGDKRETMYYRKKKVTTADKTDNPDLLDVSPDEYDLCFFKKKCPKRKLCRQKKKEIGKEQQKL